MKHRFLSSLVATLAVISGLTIFGFGAGSAHAAGFNCALVPNSEITAVGLGPVTTRRTGGPYDCTFFTPKGIVMFFNYPNTTNSNTSLPAQYGKSHLVNGHAVIQDRQFAGCGDAMAYVPRFVIVVTPICASTDKLAEYITSHIE